jgi:hypothetical protein
VRVQVSIFDNLGQLRKSVEGVFVDNAITAGYYHACRSRYFGRIGLWRDIMGAGYFAHELQHFIHDYMLDREETNNEKIAWMAGDLTSQFWTKWYELYPEAK